MLIELRRLDVATALEAKRGFVFPETSVIIRDIQKLQAAIAAAEGGGAPVGTAIGADDDAESELRALLEADDV